MVEARASTQRTSSRFVGRHAEAALIGLTLDQLGRGPAALIVRGEPGIGKTRLLSEAIGKARANGHRVIWVRANALEARVPFGALSLALDRAADDDAAIVPGAEAMRRYVGGLGAGDAAPGEASAVRLSFAQMCDTFTRMLIELGEQAPTAVIVDDVHHLDYESLSLLGVVLGRVAERNVSFVCSTRSRARDLDSHAAELLARLTEWPDVEELNLGPLSEIDVTAVLEDVYGKPVARSVADVVTRRSGGNPLFVLEMARSMSELDMLDTSAADVAFQHGPGDLHLTRHTAILQRLFPLSADCRRVAQIVAVLHRIRLTDLDLVTELTDLGNAEIAAAFDELERRGIVTSDGDGSWSLFHPFVTDALYDDIGPAERRRIHRVVADHMRSTRRRGGVVDTIRLSWHVAESADVGDVEAARLLGEAAESIKDTGPVSAAELCQRALALLPVDANPDDAPLRTHLLSLRTRCLILAARPDDAVVSGLDALQSMPPGEERLRVATAVIGALFDTGRLDEARALADREVADGGPSPFLLAQRAMLLAAQGAGDLVGPAIDAALAAPVRSAGETVLVRAHVASATAMSRPMSEGLQQFELLRLASLDAHSTMTVYGLTRRCWSLVISGFVESGAAAIAEAEAVLGDIGPGTYSSGVTAARIGIDWMRGEWDQALAAVITARRGMEFNAIVWRYLQSIEIEIRTARGQVREALALVNQPIPGGSESLATWATAGALLATGDDAGARSLLRTTSARPADSVWLPHLLSRLVEAEHRAGDQVAAQQALGELEGVPGIHDDPRPWVQALRLRCRAPVHGDQSAAIESARLAATEGLVYDAALARLVAGTMDPTDTELLLSAHETFSALGAEADRRRAATLLRDRGAKVPRRRRRAANQLTRAEAQIARLVQTGMRNREIARAANYSERTVEVYLSRIYAKLGVSSRLQLARLLDDQGLADDDGETE